MYVFFCRDFIHEHRHLRWFTKFIWFYFCNGYAMLIPYYTYHISCNQLSSHCKHFCCHSQMESISYVSLSYIMYTHENDYSYVFAINCPHIVNSSVVIVKWGPSVMFLYLRGNQSFSMLFHCCVSIITAYLWPQCQSSHCD